MTERRKAPIEVMERLAEAFVEWANIPEPPEGPARVRCWVERCQPALSAYRAATAPLRTRASVDAEIVRFVRERIYKQRAWNADDLFRLCSEPTSDDHGSSSTPAAKESRDNAGVSAGPTNEPLEDPEPCGCEEGDALKRKLADIRVEWELGYVTCKKSYAEALYIIGQLLNDL